MADKMSGTENLKKSLDAWERVKVRGGSEADYISTRNRITALNVLDSELGKHTDQQPLYQLDEATRDRLIVHTRQDASHSLANSMAVLDQLVQIRRFINVIIFGAVALAILYWLLSADLLPDFIARLLHHS